jgi:hypothetical protein
MDRLLLENTPDPTVPVAPPVVAARERLRGATAAFLRIEDGVLERPWAWLGAPGETELRYGIYRAYELLESAAADAGRRLEGAGVVRAPAARIVGPATAARWELHGALAPLGDADLDRDPGGGEWTIRQALGHIVNSQRAYGWFTAWWLARADAEEFPPRVPDEVAPDFPEEDAEGAGSLDEIRARLDEILDLAAGRLGGLDDRGLAARARWSGFAVDVGFRLGRWSSHLREHTVQVDKTLAMLGRQPTEVERLVRLVNGAYGRLESVVFALPPEDVERSGSGAVVARAGEELASLAEEVAAAAA